MSPPSSPRCDPSALESSSRLLESVNQRQTARRPMDVAADAAAMQLQQSLPVPTTHRRLEEATLRQIQTATENPLQSLYSTLRDSYAVMPQFYQEQLRTELPALFPRNAERDVAALSLSPGLTTNFLDARNILARHAYSQRLQLLAQAELSYRRSIALPPPGASLGAQLNPARIPLTSPVPFQPQRVGLGQVQSLPGIPHALRVPSDTLMPPMWPQRTFPGASPPMPFNPYQTMGASIPRSEAEGRVTSVAGSARLPEKAMKDFNADSSSQASSLDEKIASLSHQRDSSPEDSKPKSFPSERSSLSLKGDCTSPREAYRVLQMLGSTLRSKADPFIDTASLPMANGPECKRVIRGTDVFFPDQLHMMLTELESDARHTNIVSFLPHGRAFRVHNKERFIAEILPKYFGGQGKWTSFLRQLKLYGFLRVGTGPDKVSFWACCHSIFALLLRLLTHKRVGSILP